MSNGIDPLQSALAAHCAEGAQEATDVARLQLLITNGRPWDRSTPLHTTASALIIHPATKRVLLRWHERQQSWLQVGGHANPGELDPFQVAMREATEETGLPDLVAWPDHETHDIVHVVIVPVPAACGEAAHEHADVRYIFSTAVPEAAAPESPSAPLRWCSLHQATRATNEANLRETLARVSRILDP